MTDDICPFMSGPIKLPDGYFQRYEIVEAPCIRDRCVMWRDSMCGMRP